MRQQLGVNDGPAAAVETHFKAVGADPGDRPAFAVDDLHFKRVQIDAQPERRPLILRYLRRGTLSIQPCPLQQKEQTRHDECAAGRVGHEGCRSLSHPRPPHRASVGAPQPGAPCVPARRTAPHRA
jgi:hypothetical protein